MTTTNSSQTLVLMSRQSGIVIIPVGSPLTRLNYFDGKFLRASDLKAEQDYMRQLVQQSNQAGGSGVAHGFNVTLGSGDMLNIGPGLAIDGEGRVLLMPQGTSIGIQDLIDKSRDLQPTDRARKVATGNFGDCVMKSADSPTQTTHPNAIYKIVISLAEALCGEEDVYGRLCEDACATSTDRPFAIEGLVVRAVLLESPIPILKGAFTQTHLRSRVASGFFEYERNLVASLISGDGLKQPTWCLGAEAGGDGGVSIGVIARAGASTVFLDPWIVRRELIDTPARRYWQWRMMMRPWDVFLAQILQFQCQLRDLYRNFPDPGVEGSPCEGARDVINEAATAILDLRKFYELTTQRFVEINRDLIPFEGGADRLSNLNLKLEKVHKALSAMPADRWLITGGIVELPSAGYLPVVPGGNPTVNQQVRRMMGEGVDLRFCIVRPDYVGHALEEAQHMERISLTEGLDNPQKRPEVDILVPEGVIVEPQQTVSLHGFAVEGALKSEATFVGEPTHTERTLPLPTVTLQGAARYEAKPAGGTAFYLSCASQHPYVPGLRAGLDLESWKREAAGEPNFQPTDGQPPIGLWLSIQCDADLLKLNPGDTANLSVSAVVVGRDSRGLDIVEFDGTLDGKLSAETVGSDPAHVVKGTGQLTGKASVPEPGIQGQSTDDYISDARFISAKEILIHLMHKDGRLGIMLGLDASNPSVLRPFISVTLIASPTLVFVTKLDGSLTEDTNVFSEANTNHVLAVKALKSISGALKNQSFATDKGKLLFPPQPPKAAVEPSVLAIRDWVLFHRRRTKECAVDTTPARRYRVYQINPDGIVPQQPLTREDLQLITPNKRILLPIGEVTFGGGVPTITSDVGPLKTAWKKFPGGQIRWGAIGSRGDAANDGDSLAQSRLRGLESALDQVSATARADVLPIVPPLLDQPDVDGVILLLNGPLAIRRYRVYEMVATAAFLKTHGTQINFADLLSKDDGWEAIKPELWAKLFTLIGDVAFEGGTPQFAEDIGVLKNTWKKVPSGVISRGAIASQGDAIGDGNALARERLKAVEEALDGVDPNARLDVLPAVPPLDSAGVDGVILLINGKFGLQPQSPSNFSIGIGPGNL